MKHPHLGFNRNGIRVFGRVFFDMEADVFAGIDHRGKLKFSRCTTRVGSSNTPEHTLRRSSTMFAKS
jgi:hypothetical protein